MNLTKQFLQAVFAAVFAISTLVIAAAPASAATYEVTMGAGGLAFAPKTLTVEAGDTVLWTNGMLGPHNVMFDRTAPKAIKDLSQPKLLYKPGASVETTIPADAPPGQYRFFCQPHQGAGMGGVLTVK